MTMRQLLAWMDDPVPVNELTPEVGWLLGLSKIQAADPPICPGWRCNPACLLSGSCLFEFSLVLQALGCGNAGGAPGAGSSAASAKPAATSEDGGDSKEQGGASPLPPPKKGGKKRKPADEDNAGSADEE